MLSKLKLSHFLTIEDIFFTVLTGLLVFAFPYLLIPGTELGCILTSGNFVLNNFPVLNGDNYIYTTLNPYWFNANWLSDLIWASLFKLGSFNMLVIAGAILTSLTITVIFKWMNYTFNNWFINLILLIIGVFAISPYLAVSDRLFSYLFIVLLFILLENLYTTYFKSRTVLLSAFIIILWANLGIDFVFGILLTLIYAFSALIEYSINKTPSGKTKFYGFLYLFTAFLAASLLTPYGLNLWVMIIQYFLSGMFVSNGYLASPNFHSYYPTGFFEAFILINIVLALVSGYKPQLSRIMIVVLFLALSLYSAVLIPFFVILALPIITDVLKNTILIPENNFTIDFIRYTRTSNKLTAPLLSIIFFFIITIAGLSSDPYDTSSKVFINYPVESAKYLKRFADQEHIYNPLGWGCYLRFASGCKMFIVEDMLQQDIKTLNNHERINNFYDNYQKLLDKYNINWIIYPKNGMLSVALKENSCWKKVFQDNIADIYKRKIGSDEK